MPMEAFEVGKTVSLNLVTPYWPVAPDRISSLFLQSEFAISLKTTTRDQLSLLVIRVCDRSENPLLFLRIEGKT